MKTAPLHALQVGALERMLWGDAVLRDLRSPWLSPPLDCGLEEELLFRVAPYAPAGTLKERLARGPLSVKETLQLGRGLLRALREAHAQRVLHRHLKPSNVVIPLGRVFQEATLIDFGLALEDLREDSLLALPLTATQYLSPEQLGLVAGDVGPASDLYAVGMMLFEGLAGAPLFQGETRGEILRQHLCVIPELRARGLPVPRALEQVVQHLLSGAPQERYQSAAAALSDLEAISSELERGISEPSVVVGRSDRHPRLTEPAFIGRAAELEELERTLREATQGRGGLILVGGESGVGKTMLLDELERRSLAHGARVLRGRALDRAAPQPLQTLLGVVPVPAFQGPESLGEGLMIRALVKELDALGSEQTPALVLLDDCQWSDELTLKVLAALAKSSDDAPRADRFVTVVVAFRTEEVREDHPLRQMTPMRHVSLAPFTAPDLRCLAESMAGHLPDEALDVVVRLSAGNPFMAAAMVRGLVECGALEPTASGWRVEPERLAEVRSSRRAATWLLRRLGLFPAETRTLLAAGAILGRAFEVDLAAVLARQPPEQAAAALEGARQRHILWPDSSKGRYTFTHDRIREALLEQLPPEEGRALHLAAALELERRTPERSFELAWHFEAAGKLERAWPHALKSADLARREHALDLAERYYRLADAGAMDVSSPARMGVLEGLGDVLRLRGKHDEAERSYMRAQALAATRLDRARLEGQRSESAFGRGDPAGASEMLERALRLLGWKVPAWHLPRALCVLWELLVRVLRSFQRQPRSLPLLEGESLLAARLSLQLPRLYWCAHQSMLAVLWAHLRGLNIVERYSPTPELAEAYANHGSTLPMLIQAIPHVPSWLVASSLMWGRKYLLRAIALREASGDSFVRGSVLNLYQFLLFTCARYEESVEAGQRAVQLLRQVSDSSEWHHGSARYYLAWAQYLLGDLEDASEYGKAVYLQGSNGGDGIMRSTGLEIWACASEGRLPGGAIATELACSTQDEEPSFNQERASLLHAEGIRLLQAGEPGQATAVLERAVQHAKLSWMRVLSPSLLPLIQSRLVAALREQASQAPACAFSRRARLLRQSKSVAREVLRHPRPFRENLAFPLRELGLIAAMEGRDARARRYFGQSLAIAERMGLRYERARTLRARAEVGAALGWPEAAQDATAAEEAMRPMRAVLEPAPAAEPQVSLSLVDRFPRILEAGRTIASALTREAVLSSVREAALGLLRGEECVLTEATPEGLLPLPKPGGTIWPFMQRACELKRPVVPSVEELESAGGGPERSVLCAPIVARGQVAALFCVTNHKLAGAFGPQELRIAEYIATLAGAALENAQGFAEVNAFSEERGRLYREAQEALRKRDEFLAVASHELRTPFTPMRIYLQGLISTLRNPAKAAGLGHWVTKLETANARLQRLAKLVEDLFDVSRLAEGKVAMRLEEVDLAALAAEAVDRWKAELTRVQCDCTLDAPGPVIGHWDGLRLEQVIDNLLGNATKYGPGKPITVTVKREGAVARLSVQDHGIGIAPEEQPRIFERFERAVSENYGGFGLGLWISREVVQAHGGCISVESAPGQGATFTVELPLTNA